jgi:drug/metabolite transporter (DMT)-like permease
MVLVFYFSVVCCIFSPIASYFTEEFHSPSKSQWLPMIGLGVVASLGQVCLNRGLQLEKAAKASAMNYLQIVFAFIMEITIFRQDVNPWSIGGALLITGS